MSKNATYYCPMHLEVTAQNPGDCAICGMSLEPLVLNKPPEDEEIKGLKWRALFAAALTIPIACLHNFPDVIQNTLSLQTLLILEVLVSTLVVFVAGWPLLSKGVRSFIYRKLNMYSLISLGILTAYFYSLYRMISPYVHHQPFADALFYELYFEPSSVITTLILIGQWIEAKALKKTSQQIERLMQLAPSVAHLNLPSGEERKIAVENIKNGDLLSIKPGAKIPADGVVKEGQSWVNESMITGEGIPVFKRPNSIVLTGTLNGNNTFSMVAEKTGEDTVLAGMIQVIATASLSQAPIQKRADKIAAYFIPTVIVIALATAILWTVIGNSFPQGVMHAIAVLIIACPSAFILSAPMSMAVGIGLGASRGILIKDAEALEKMEKVTTLIIDKTGTLTEGKPMLTKIFARFPFSEPEVLKFAACVEQNTDHPLGLSIVMGAKLKQIPLLKADNFQNIEGKGVIADVDGSRIAVGNAQLLTDLLVDPSSLVQQAMQWQKEGLTVSFVSLEYRAIGLIAVADPIKFTAERALQQLNREHIKVIMATGDSTEAALAAAKRLHIDEVHAGALPQDKMALVQKLQKEGKIVAMAGDGITDAPALSQADVGIAMTRGSDSTIYNSNITLMKGDLCGVVRARGLSRITMKNVQQNLFLAFLYNILAIPLASGLFYAFPRLGMTPVIACIAMVLSSLLIIANSLRLKKQILYD
jgi:Cu+-exporting ATPase